MADTGVVGMNFFDRVYDIVRSIPSGAVVSYGQVAFLAGNPRMARQVGWALHACPEDVPWHRVVRKDGSNGKAFFSTKTDACPASFSEAVRTMEKEIENLVVHTLPSMKEAHDALEGATVICYRPMLTER